MDVTKPEEVYHCIKGYHLRFCHKDHACLCHMEKDILPLVSNRRQSGTMMEFGKLARTSRGAL